LWNQIGDAHAAEAHACLLSIVVGTNLVAAASDLVSLFLALELVSIPTYVLLYLSRSNREGREATIKYFLLSVFSSSLVLYGMSWLYGMAGTTNFAAIAAATSANAVSGGDGRMQIAFALIVAGLCFRIAAVPFHFYAPDVFQGTSASNAAVLSFVPKVVGFVALLRLLPLTGVSESLTEWRPDDVAQPLLAVLAVATMFVGNLMALRQSQLHRLMAYSSVAHAGYLLVGLASGNVGAVGGTDAVLYYLAVYGLMTIGVFALFDQLPGTLGSNAPSAAPAAGTSRQLDDLRGLGRSQPTLAVLLSVCLFSLTGLPPTAGFLGKLNLFLAAWSGDNTLCRWLAVIMAANAAIAAWYYLRLIALMFLEPAVEPATRPVRSTWPSWLAGAACTIATVAIFIAPQWLWTSLP
jgi:NADH-quinone oxidoreductase subunit N